MCLLEAMSQGAKVLITQEGSTKEYFQDFATYVDPKSMDNIKIGLTTILNRIHKLEKAREHILTQFTWDKTADDIIQGYLELM